MGLIAYTANTPNGHKLTCTLQELGLNYTVEKIHFDKNEQKSESYLKINPNGRIPGLKDKNAPFGEYDVMESGAQMLYLVDLYDKKHKLSFPQGSNEYYDMIQWLFWMNAGLGPMQGQANHFYRYAPEKIKYGIERYQNETRRLYSVVEDRLQNRNWLAGDHISIADIAVFCWTQWHDWAGIETDKFPKLTDFNKRMHSRPAIQRGLDQPDKDTLEENLEKERRGEKCDIDFHAKWVIDQQNRDAQGNKSRDCWEKSARI